MRGVFWSIAGTVISRGIMFVAAILVARILGVTGYGELGMIQSTVGMIGVLAGFGLGLTATKHVAEFRQSDPERAGRVIGLSGGFALLAGGLMALGLFILAPWLAENTINAPHLVDVLRIGSLMLFISAVNGAQIGVLSGFEAFKTIARVNIIASLVSFPIIVGGAYLGDLVGMVWALTINLAINSLLTQLAVRRVARQHGVHLKFEGCYHEMPILWKFSLPAVLAGVMVGPVKWICNALLVNQPDGYKEMGILTAALVFQNLLTQLNGMLSAPLLTMMVNVDVVSNNSEKVGTINILSSWVLGVIFACPLLCFPEIAIMLFGSDYDSYTFKVAFSLVILCAVIMSFKEGLARVLAARNLLWWGFFSNTIWAVILIVSTFFLVNFGAIGLAAALVIAYMLNVLFLFPIYYSRNLIPKGTLLSVESIIIWGVVVALTLSNVADMSLGFRSFLFVFSILLVGIAFKRIAIKPYLDR